MSLEDRGHLLELLDTLESGVLGLERSEDGDPVVVIHRLFQSAHNLKSGLAMAGLERASKLFHSLEDGLDDIRRGRRVWSTAWADVVLETVDRIKACLEEGQDETLDPTFTAPDEGGRAATATGTGLQLYRIEKLFRPGLSREDFEGHLILEDIRDSGTLVSVTPDWEGYARATDEVVVRYVFSSTKGFEGLSDLFFDPLIPLGPAPEAAPGATEPEGFRILVVDDDPLIFDLVAARLKKYGTVARAHDGPPALAAFTEALEQRRGFDLVVLDLTMPQMAGEEVLAALRTEEDRRGILGLDRCLVFIHTSSDNLETVRKVFRLQADGYFVKPLSFESIEKRLEDYRPWLDNRRRGSV